MNFNRIDLHLLRFFDTVFEERNLMRAAKRLPLSRSAISHALGRLHRAVDDALGLKAGRGARRVA